MTVGTAKLFFIMDPYGQPTELYYNSGSSDAYYYYVRNIQGDVIALLDKTGNTVVEYTYDAWGKPLSISGTMADTLGALNPLRYRGYFYDSDTGLYYLQSRYYDPEIGRFINADEFASTGQGILSNNMFAYSLNNPVNFKDPSGNFAISAIAGAAIGGAVAGAVVGTVSYIVSSGINNTALTASGLGTAIAIGAVNGAIGAVNGAIGASIGVVGGVAAKIGSVVVGVISAGATAYNTSGSFEQKLVAGGVAGVVAGVGTYLGTNFPVPSDSIIASGIEAYAGTLFASTQTEIVNVVTQEIVSSQFSSKKSTTPLTGGVSKSNYHTMCRY